jgi:hypothetical protein
MTNLSLRIALVMPLKNYEDLTVYL